MEHKSFRKYSRNSQKLIYWLLSDYSNFIEGNPVGYTPTEYHLSKAKKEVKKIYMREVGINPDKLNPFRDFRNILKLKIDDTLSKNISNLSKVDVILDDVEVLIKQEFQKLMIKLDETFSLQLNLLSQEKANKFITWLFDFFIDKEIPLRKEISDLYKKQEDNKYIYTLLKKRKCAVCGEYADLHHYDPVSRVGGYEYDTGTNLRLIPLCRNHHTEFHNIGIKEWNKKYQMEGIFLKEEDIPIFKKIYPNHFKEHKEEK